MRLQTENSSPIRALWRPSELSWAQEGDGPLGPRPSSWLEDEAPLWLINRSLLNKQSRGWQHVARAPANREAWETASQLNATKDYSLCPQLVDERRRQRKVFPVPPPTSQLGSAKGISSPRFLQFIKHNRTCAVDCSPDMAGASMLHAAHSQPNHRL